MSTIEDIRKQLTEHNINRLSDFRNGIIAKIGELTDDTNKPKDTLIKAIEELQDIKLEGAAKELVDDRLTKLRKELDILMSPNTLESLKSTLNLVEKRISELQVLGC